MIENLVRVPTVRITPRRITMFDNFLVNNTPVRLQDLKGKKISITGSRPHISHRSQTKIRTAIDYLTTISPKKTVYDQAIDKSVTFNLVFVTLTLSSEQVHSDNELKKIVLHQFITEITKVYKVNHYLWRMEKQCNLNTHFHFVFNRFIPYYELRQRWNRIQNKLGYVDRYRTEMLQYFKDGFRLSKNPNDKRDYQTQLAAYKLGVKTDWSQPNSTDIHSVFNVSNLSLYVSKYMAKSEKENHTRVLRSDLAVPSTIRADRPSVSPGAIQYLRSVANIGRLWGSDVGLSRLKGFSQELDSQIDAEITRLKADKRSWFVNTDYCGIIYYDLALLRELKCTAIFTAILNNIIDSLGVSDYYSKDTC